MSYFSACVRSQEREEGDGGLGQQLQQQQQELKTLQQGQLEQE
jgi:hypothetical protein